MDYKRRMRERDKTGRNIILIYTIYIKTNLYAFCSSTLPFLERAEERKSTNNYISKIHLYIQEFTSRFFKNLFYEILIKTMSILRCIEIKDKNIALFILSVCAFTQSAIVSGANNAVLSTIERAYYLSTVESALFLSLYDIANILASPIIGYFGDRGSKAKLIAFSMLGLSLASLAMILPQFLSSSKHFEPPKSDLFRLCHVTNKTNHRIQTMPRKNFYKKIKFFFYASNFINGISSVSMHTIVVSYIERMFKKEQVPIRQGIYFAVSAMGVGIGMLLTGNFLNISAQKNLQHSYLFNSHSYDWVGAWWIIYTLSFILNIFLSILVFHFSPSLSGSSNESSCLALNDFVKNALKITSGKIFCLITLCTTFETFLIKGFASYLTKFFEYQYRLEASKATMIAGGIGFLSFVLGPLTGAYLVKKLEWNARNCAKFVCVILFLTSFAFFGLITTCKQETYAKMDKKILCKCDPNYFYPICFGHKMMFQSPCHAGCLKYTKPNMFSNCLVFSNQTTHMTTCSRPASQCILNLALVSVLSLVILFLSSIVFLPILRVLLESVGEENQSFALGIRSLVNKLFGNIPGPIVFALVLDRSCIQWTVREIGGNRTCRLYNNKSFSLALASMGGAIRFLSALSAFWSLYFLQKQDTLVVTFDAKDQAYKKKFDNDNKFC
ncbi:solute carrier organic anion transporter family member 4A1-like isoform X2 [Brachionus plicatilis]|uniref:Solute carrier organic anion transporter family member 4A1-like isoform X2 n=1 Tax=Brachionus plicatilis TaxID=10195 RepID=A0A3M7PVI5_BRAPC|nr:solute carrier organic anion transporter family member 4A1-like isoform X2 [Brachionus plicatilis]